jgi:hypothetical protein
MRRASVRGRWVWRLWKLSFCGARARRGGPASHPEMDQRKSTHQAIRPRGAAELVRHLGRLCGAEEGGGVFEWCGKLSLPSSPVVFGVEGEVERDRTRALDRSARVCCVCVCVWKGQARARRCFCLSPGAAPWRNGERRRRRLFFFFVRRSRQSSLKQTRATQRLSFAAVPQAQLLLHKPNRRARARNKCLPHKRGKNTTAMARGRGDDDEEQRRIRRVRGRGRGPRAPAAPLRRRRLGKRHRGAARVRGAGQGARQGRRRAAAHPRPRGATSPSRRSRAPPRKGTRG